MKYFDLKFLPLSDLRRRTKRLARYYMSALGLIGLLALASLALLIGQIDSQGRYARMIEQRQTQRLLTLHATLFSMLLGPEKDPARRQHYCDTINGALQEIERLQQLFSPPSPDDRAAADLAERLHWFATAERSLLAPANLQMRGSGSPDQIGFLTADASALRDAFDNIIESYRGASLRRTHLYQGLATGAVGLLLLTLLAEAQWIFRPLLRGIRQETEALAESQERLGAVLDTVGEAIVVADGDNTIQTVNSEAARIWGSPAEDLIGQKLNELVLAGRELLPGDWRAMFPSTGRFETVGVRRDGEPFRVELSLARTSPPEPENLATSSSPASLFFTVSARDITGRRDAGQELAGAHHAAQAKGAFVTRISQELHTHLHGMREITGQLAKSALTPPQRSLLGSIGRQSEALKTVLDDLIDFSKIETGQLALEPGDFDLRHLVEGAADILAGRAVQKQLELLAFVAPDVPTALRGDSARLRRVLLHLVGNAIKFTRHGEVIIEVSLESAVASDVTLRFSVRDTGAGIAPEDHPRLFRAFSDAGEIEDGGRGMGLMICRQLVELMGGGIDFESVPGKGSTFWFSVPLQQRPRASPSLPQPAEAEEELIAGLRGVRILIVDDNATCRNLVSARVAAWGMIPSVAETGGDALTLLRGGALAGKPFEVAMLDLNLGSMDGFTLAWSIHSQPMLAQTRLVLMTALGLEKDRAADRQVGILGSVSKPLKHGAVLQVLAKVLAAEQPTAETLLQPRVSAQPRQTQRINMSEAPLQTGGRRILLADDNPINRKLALRQLANLGFPADAVGNGQEVLAALRAQRYGMVILDLHMPVLDGYETARTIRRLLGRQRGDHLTLVAITANRTGGDRQRCLELGINDYLAKPVHQDDLGRLLARWNGAAPSPRLDLAAEARIDSALPDVAAL